MKSACFFFSFDLADDFQKHIIAPHIIYHIEISPSFQRKYTSFVYALRIHDICCMMFDIFF